MKKRRYTFWRWLLALLLGAGTWGLIGWWQSPRLHFEAWYSTKAAVNLTNAVHHLKMNINDSSLGQGDHLSPKVWDTKGRYLVVEGYWYRLNIFLEVIDLQSRKVVARHDSLPAELDLSSLRNVKNQAKADGLMHLIKTASGYTADQSHSPQLARSVFNRELWQWNVLTNEAKLLRQYPMRTTRSICEDGSAMLEVQQTTPLLPMLMLPASLPNLLSALVDIDLGINDLALMRVLSLPDLTQRSTVILPWMLRQEEASLSHDGSYLIIPDANTMEGFTSSVIYRQESHHGFEGGGRGTVTAKDIHVTQPTGLRVYDTATGRLWWESSGLPKSYSRFEANTPLVKFMSDNRGTLEDDELLLHLPSKKIIKSLATNSIVPLDDSHVQFTQLRLIDDTVLCEIHVIDKDGQTRKVAERPDVTQKLLPNAPQFLYRDRRSEMFIDKVADWLHEHKWFMAWDPRDFCELKVEDYTRNRVLWRFRSKVEPDCTITDHWLILQQREKEGIRLSVYALPFPSWSPWWAITAGLLVLIVSTYWLCIRVKGNLTP